MSLDQKLSVAGLILAAAAWLIAPKKLWGFCKNNLLLVLILLLVTVIFYCSEYGWLNWVFYPVVWPIGGLMLFGFLCLVIPIVIIFIIASLKKQPPIPDPTTYKTDEILGVQWVWNYHGAKLDGTELSAFCPNQKCKCRLDTESACAASGGYYRVDEPRLSFHCPNCGLKRDFDVDMDKLKRKVFIEIERRIRTGEYVQRI